MTCRLRCSGLFGSVSEQDNLLAAWSWAIDTGNIGRVRREPEKESRDDRLTSAG
jgi:hypothetical protein